MQERDLACFLLRADGSILVAFTPPDGTVEHQLLWLFNLTVPDSRIQVSAVGTRSPEFGLLREKSSRSLELSLKHPQSTRSRISRSC